MMLHTSLTPAPDQQLHFQRSEMYNAPDQSGCYVLTVHNGNILYIGQSINLANRMEQHLSDPAKTVETALGKAFWFYYMLCNAIELDSIERGWINEYKLAVGELPPLNIINPPV